jgi:hypothetical protein
MKLAIRVIVVLAAVIGPAGAQVEPPKPPPSDSTTQPEPGPRLKFNAPPSKIKFGFLIGCEVRNKPGWVKTPPSHKFIVTNTLKTSLPGGTTYNV